LSPDGLDDLVHGVVDLMGLVGPGKVDGALSQEDVALRLADHLATLHRRHRDGHGRRIAEPDIFGGHPDEASET
jgi:hypothetical protein